MTLDDKYVLAFDIGGTKIAAGLVDAKGGIRCRQELPTLAEEGRDAILERVEALGQQVLNSAPDLEVSAVGAASAGQIDPRSGRVNYATDNLPGWEQLELTKTLTRMFGMPAAADNDVNAMALAEMQYGAGKGHQDVFCVMVGTGIGGAIITQGRLYNGVLGGAGEFGHVSIQAYGGRACACGGTGCVEMYASSRAVLSDFIEAAGASEIEHRLGIPASRLTIRGMGAAFRSPAYQDWSVLRESIAQGAEALGAGLAAAANLLAPELIVIAGSITLLGPGYLEMVSAALERRAMAPRRATPLTFSSLGADPALMGAALLARQRAR